MIEKNEQIMSVMIDKELYSTVRKFCYANEIKIKNFISDSLKAKLDKEGRYGKSNVIGKLNKSAK